MTATRATFSLENRTALVTGANAGLGRAFAIALASAGADIVAVGRATHNVKIYFNETRE